MTYEYTLTVEGEGKEWTAYLDPGRVLSGTGSSPLQAVRALCSTLKAWPVKGAGRWLRSHDGKLLKERFVRPAR